MTMRQSAIGFYSKRLELEGIVASPTADDDAPRGFPAAIVCHSHPALGGSMNDAVVSAFCISAAREGIATLRFNFRGVGGSEGEYTNGKQERHDVKAALDVMRNWRQFDRDRLALVGYSTGAAIALGDYRRLRAAAAVALVAPTIGALRNRRFARDKRPRLVIAGSRDNVAPSLEIQRLLDDCEGPVQFYEALGADHSMRGFESEIADAAADFLKRNL